MTAQILEAAMLICFGLSWPMNAYKSYKAATAVSTSWQFITLITAGYLAGIAAKFFSGDINWVLVVYFLNLACLALNWAVYFRNKKLGFVFQFYNLVPDLTIRENIEVTAHLSANPLPIDDLLHSLGLYEHRAKFPRQVSGGQQQRCAIGRALVKNPGLLLCDEPTGALDYQTSKEILELMEDVNRDYGCTVVIVTHNDAIKHMAHRVLRLRDGKLAEDAANVERMAARDLTW